MWLLLIPIFQFFQFIINNWLWILIAIVAFFVIGMLIGYLDLQNKNKEQDSLKQADLDIINKYKHLTAEEIAISKDFEIIIKVELLMGLYGYTSEEAYQLIKTAIKEEQRVKLKSVKRKITQRLAEQYNDIPVDDRQPIADDVKTYVWQRDRGKCVQCGGNEKLEFDHIIPFSKGGSNTERNIQLLCEKCNREKSNNI